MKSNYSHVSFQQEYEREIKLKAASIHRIWRTSKACHVYKKIKIEPPRKGNLRIKREDRELEGIFRI